MTPIETHTEDLLDRTLLAFGKQLAVSLVPRAEDRMRDERAVVLTMSKIAKRVRRRHVRQIWLLAAAVICVAGAAGAHLWRQRGPAEAQVGASLAAPPHALRRQAFVPMVDMHLRAAAAEPTSTDKQQPRSVLASDESETAAALFSQANELRRTGRDDQAIQMYRKLQRLFSGTPQAEQSHATLGQLLLQRLSADEALAQFDRYLAHEGPLTEDVLVGRALSLQRLGRGHEERRTWETLLHRFPSSVHATRAKARLADLPIGQEVR